MVSLFGKPLLHHQLDAIEHCGIGKQDIALVGGYLQSNLDAPGIKQYRNDEFDTTNMVSTLFCAEDFMKDGEDLIISYGDIIYKPEILKMLMESEGDMALTADKDWVKLWSLRMDNPLDDAETFKMDESFYIQELGKKPVDYSEVEAQYMGLIKVSGEKVKSLKDYYYSLSRSTEYDGKNFENMYMTSFIQSLINDGWGVKAVLISNGWVEVDTAEELDLYESIGFKKIILQS